MSPLKSGATCFGATCFATCFGDQLAPAIITRADGKLLAAWTTVSGEDENGTAVKVALFNTSLTQIGNDWVGNIFTQGDQKTPALAPLPGTGYILLWQTTGQDGGGIGITGRRFPSP